MSYAKFIGKEDDFQKTLAKYLDFLGVVWFHSPNEIRASVQYLRKRKAMGVKSGVPDVLILEPKNGFNGLAIELKVNYNKPSESQLEWLKMLETKCNYKTLWTNSLEQAINEIDIYLNIKQ